MGGEIESDGKIYFLSLLIWVIKVYHTYDKSQPFKVYSWMNFDSRI